MAKVCHISTVHSAFDGRIFHKECVALQQLGHDVSLVVSHNKEETVNGVKIIPLSMNKGRLYRIFFKSFIAMFKALRTKSDVYHFHDPELLIIAFLIRFTGKKVIFDMHELVYHQITDKRWLGGKFVSKIIARIYLVFERFAVLIFNGIILAEDGYRDHFESRYPKKMYKIHFIRNYPLLKEILAVPEKEKDPNKLILFYAGGLTRIRGIKEVCDAVNRCQLNVELHLLGKWSDDELAKECINEKVNYYGMLPLMEVYPLMKAADIGISTLYPVENYLTSLPVKAFEYMACGIPILMSNFDYWQDKFKDVALFVDPKDVDGIKKQIEFAFENKSKLSEMGKLGSEIVQSSYSWENESHTLGQIYSNLRTS